MDRRGARGGRRRFRRRDHVAPTRCRPNSSASRWRRGPAAPPTCRSRIATAPATCSAAAGSTEQMPVREALGAAEAAAGGPLGAEDRLQTSSSSCVVMNRHGIDIAPYDDTHADLLRARRRHAAGHGMDELADNWLGHKSIKLKDLAGSGRSVGRASTASPLDRATAYAAEDADVTLQALAGAEAAARRRKAWSGLRAAGAAAGARCSAAWSSAASRSTGRSVAGCRASWRRGRPRSRTRSTAGRRALHHRLAQAARRHPVRQDGPARRRRRPRPGNGRHGAGAGRAGGRRPRAAAQDRRLAPADQAEIDLYRRAARLRPSRHQARPHLLRAGRDHDGTAVLVGAEPAEHPGAHRRGPQDQDAPSSPTRATS